MKIVIESFYGDKVLINDKNYTLEDVKQMYKNISVLVDPCRIPEMIAKMYAFKIEDYDFNSDYNYDYFIYVDINKVYSKRI